MLTNNNIIATANPLVWTNAQFSVTLGQSGNVIVFGSEDSGGRIVESDHNIGLNLNNKGQRATAL